MAGFRLEDAVLHEDEDIVVVDKPPNALCVPGRYIKDSLVVRVADHFSIQVGGKAVGEKRKQGAVRMRATPFPLPWADG